MLDVSFLGQPVAKLPIVYRYRDGWLRSRILRAIEEMLRKNGKRLSGAAPDTLVQSISNAGLFDEFVPFCDWPTKRSRTLARQADAALGAFCQGDSRDFILFAHESANLFDSGVWPMASQRCFVLEEVVVAAATLPAVMKYYWSVTDLPYCPVDHGAIQRQLLLGGFDKQYPDLGQFIPAVDRAMLSRYDAGSGAFATDDAVNETATERSYVLRPLRRLLESDADAIQDLVCGIEVKLRRQLLTADEVLTEMYGVTRDLLREADDRETEGAAEPRSLYRVVLWTVSTIVGLPHLAEVAEASYEKLGDRPEPFLAEFDFICRDFVRRLSCDVDNPFPDLWTDIEHILAQFIDFPDVEYPTREGSLLLELAEYLARLQDYAFNPAWMKRLTTLLQHAVEARRRRQGTLEDIA